MLPQHLRLPAIEIVPLMRRGTHIRSGVLEFVYKKAEASSHFACIISTKVEKLATRRNRMRRLVREAAQYMLPTLSKAIDGVIVIRGTLPDRQEEVSMIVRELLNRASESI